MATPTRVVVRSALALLLTVCLLSAPLTVAATAAAIPASGRCLLGARSECVNNFALARTEDEEEIGDEAEAEEAEEELAAAEEREEAEESETAEEAGSTATGASEGSRGSQPSHESHRKVAVVSHLTLTPAAAAALKHGKPSASTVRFAFTLSAPAKVHVTLVRQTNTHGHKHWRKLPDSMVTAVPKGHRSRGLTGRNRLWPGRYRLTVKPAGGRSRSIYLSTTH